MSQAVVDYSFARPGATAIRDAGYVGAVRYLSPPPNGKNLDAGERDELLGAGLAIGLVWETTETRPREGYEAGRSDATRANEMADALSAPRSAAIYYAVDRNDTTPEMVADYFRGVLDIGGRSAGVYGNRPVCEAMLDLGCRYGWQVQTWGPGTSPRVHLVQLPNAHAVLDGTDVNDVQAPDWGQWAPGADPGTPNRVVTTGWREIDSYLASLGVAINQPPEDWQTTGGVHADTSWHYKGMARDVSTGMGCDEAGAVAAMKPFAVPDGPIIELFHAATDTWWPSNVGGHTDHAHIAIRPGASLPFTLIPEEDDMAAIVKDADGQEWVYDGIWRRKVKGQGDKDGLVAAGCKEKGAITNFARDAAHDIDSDLHYLGRAAGMVLGVPETEDKDRPPLARDKKASG